MPAENFDDVRMDHPWVEKYRLPVLKDAYPMWSYFVTVVVPDEELEADEYYRLTAPTDEEAELAASYLQYRIGMWNYYQSFLDKMAQKPLDIDGTINTVSLEKRKDGSWGYKMRTWTMHGAIPLYNAKNPCNSLMELLDFIEREYDGSGVRPKWKKFKEENGLV